MTDREPHRLCCTCFRRYVPPGAYKCDDCDLARTLPHRAASNTTRRTNPLFYERTQP